MRFLDEDNIRVVDVDGTLWLSDGYGLWRDTGWPVVEPGRWQLHADGADRIEDLTDTTVEILTDAVHGLHRDDGWDQVQTSQWGCTDGGVGCVCWWWRNGPVLIDMRLVRWIVDDYAWSRHSADGPIRARALTDEDHSDVVGAVMPHRAVSVGDLPPVPQWLCTLEEAGA